MKFAKATKFHRKSGEGLGNRFGRGSERRRRGTKPTLRPPCVIRSEAEGLLWFYGYGYGYGLALSK